MKSYSPAVLKRAMMFCEAFFPLPPRKVTAAGPVADHLYVSTDAPAESAPSTLSFASVAAPP